MSENSHFNSPEFVAFVKQIGEANSRQEEDLLVLREVTRLKKGTSEKNPSFVQPFKIISLEN